MSTFRELREQQLAAELRALRARKELPQVGTELYAYADLVEARVFARECEQTVDEWFNGVDVELNQASPSWAAAYALHKELTSQG